MMKKFYLLTISLCLAATVFAAPATAFAESPTGITDYPDLISEPLTFKALTDYAVGKDSVAFAEGSTITLWMPDENTEYYEFDAPVTALDYKDGKYYYSTGENAYILPEPDEELPGMPAEHEFQELRTYTTKDDLYYYYYDPEDHGFYVLNQTTHISTPFTDYSKIKLYNDTLYSIYENTLHIIVGEDTEPQEYIYSNFNLLTQIVAGNTAEQLKSFTDKPKTILVENCNMTEFKLDDLLKYNSGFFPVNEPKKNTSSGISGQALLLSETGKTCVVAINGNTYLLNKDNVSENGYITVEQTENATVTVNADEWAHSLPFMSNATRLFRIAPTDDISVIAKLDKDNNPELAHDFYLIEKTAENGEVLKGYVSTEFLNIQFPEFNEGGSTVLPDPAPHNDNYIKTVILVLLVIVLVLIAAGYITWVSTTGKKRATENNTPAEDDAPSTPLENK